MTFPSARTAFAAALLAALLAQGSALADPTAEDKAAADALFREGRALVKQGKFADACPKLAASQKLDPTAGSALALGDCYESAGQTASAWTTFNEARSLARKASDTPRADEGERRAKLLEAKLSNLVIDVPASARVPGLEVRRNGRVIEAALFGSSIPVDPGEQTIEVSAPGKQPFRTTLRVEPKAGVSTVSVPVLAEAPSALPTSTATVSSGPAAPASGTPSTSPTQEPVPFWGTQRTVGAVLGGVGLAGVVVGAVFGAQTLSKVGEVKDKKLCTGDSPPLCTADGIRLENEANDSANIANVALAAGGAALVAGAIVFLLAPSATSRKSSGLTFQIRPSAGVHGGGLSVHGAF